MRVVSIIPMRAGSKRIPDKNIMPFCGKPLYEWTIEHLYNSGIDGSDIYISTDYKNYHSPLRYFVIPRPDELCTDKSSSEDALLHAVNLLKLKDNDIVVFPQITSPLRYGTDIAKALEEFKIGKYDSMYSCSELGDACIWNNKKSITYDYKNRKRSQDREPLYLENGSFYIFKVGTLKKYKNRLCGKIGRYVMRPWQSYEIDNPEDVDTVKHYMKEKLL